MSSPPAAPLFLFFLSSEAFSSSTAPQAFPRPDRRMLPPARAGCVKAGRFSAATVRLGLYTTEHDGRLDRFGRLLPLSCYLSVIRSARYSDHECGFRQVLLRSPWRVRCSHQLISGSSDPACQGAACMDDRAGGMGLIFLTADWQVPICDADPQPHIRPARHTRLGVSELSALSTLSHKGRSLRNQTLLEITPEGNGELARDSDDHDALNATVLPFGPLHKPLGNRALGLMFDPQPSYLDHGRPHGTAAGARDPLRALHLAAVIRARSQSQKACDLSSVAELTIVDLACHDRGTGRTDAF